MIIRYEQGWVFVAGECAELESLFVWNYKTEL